jgi:hypothetical protein
VAFTTVIPGQFLSPQQKIGLNFVTYLHPGRDVVLAIDLTESVGLNNEGRLRLRQIVEDSLKHGDTVYVVPFASDTSSLKEASDLHPLGTPIKFNSKDNIEQVLHKIPTSANLNFQNTDIQRAELTIYRGLAQLNQNRLQQHQPIKPQSIVWITDAPLLTDSGKDWIETPANSPFRIKNSPESKERQAWLNALPLQKRELIIKNNNKDYKIAIVDLQPTVQEFCTIAPSGGNICKVNAYLFSQLWLPLVLLLLGLALLPFPVWNWLKLRQKWRFLVTSKLYEEAKECRPLLPGKSLAIGDTDAKCVDEIECPGSEVRAYLERRGNQLFLIPTQLAPIYCNGKEITKRTRLTGNRIQLNCPNEKNEDFFIQIKLKK